MNHDPYDPEPDYSRPIGFVGCLCWLVSGVIIWGAIWLMMNIPWADLASAQ